MHRINVILFLLILAGGFSSFFIIPTKEISEDEKRKLATFPNLTWQGYVNGTWADSVDLYINDHFPARDKCVEFADWLKYQKGLHYENQEKIFISPKKAKKKRGQHKEGTYIGSFLKQTFLRMCT